MFKLLHRDLKVKRMTGNRPTYTSKITMVRIFEEDQMSDLKVYFSHFFFLSLSESVNLIVKYKD